jgi:hypothetical protein
LFCRLLPGILILDLDVNPNILLEDFNRQIFSLNSAIGALVKNPFYQLRFFGFPVLGLGQVGIDIHAFRLFLLAHIIVFLLLKLIQSALYLLGAGSLLLNTLAEARLFRTLGILYKQRDAFFQVSQLLQ